MNKRYVMKTIAELQYDLENDYTETKLFDDISRAEKLFGKDVPAIHDCVEEVQHFNGTIRRNAIKAVGDEKGYTYILDPQIVLYQGNTAVDATQFVKAKLGIN